MKKYRNSGLFLPVLESFLSMIFASNDFAKNGDYRIQELHAVSNLL